uniref:Papilin-like n=1 Tax=Dermatophagoides pteronyssinus TaxID=6956 RepID=A0A6P6YJ54_DERPT|nr:papilin-like [Dermatophagoides pteronyssinus]
MMMSMMMIECPKGTEDFRANQCARFNPIPFEGRYYNWLPYYTADGNPCELNCKPENERFYYRHSKKVIDGTRCYDDDSNNICLDGVCIELGCDRALGSNIKEDNCRVCGGDGSTCRRVSGVYQQNQGLRTGYNDILYIPAGSTNITIQEVMPTNNYLAIRNDKGRYYLNGKWKIQPPATYEIADTKFHYQRARRYDNVPEKIRALGPTKEPLFIQLIYQEPNHGISYEYSVPLANENQYGGEIPVLNVIETKSSNGRRRGYPRYVWIFGDYSECSKSCGTGVQRRNVYCASMNTRTGQQERASDSLCDSSKRPPDTRPCHNEKKCTPQWKFSDWSECSCVHGIRYRNVYCSSGDSDICPAAEGSTDILPDSHCATNNQTRPENIQKCQPDSPDQCPEWIFGEWTKCDAHCGVGKQTRKVRCGRKPRSQMDLTATTTVSTILDSESETTTVTSTVITTTENSIDQELQPAKRETLADCDDDNIEYVEEYLCDLNNKPPEEQSCSLQPCEDLGSVEWVTSPWSSCDIDCAAQVQTRQVVCISRDGQVFPDKTCVELRGERPADRQDCTDGSVCSQSLWFTSEWSKCTGACTGQGMQTRHIFCGHIDDKGMVIKDDDESKCQNEMKPPKATVCELETNDDQCSKGQWFSGPSGPCNVICGGGKRIRKRFCLKTVKNNQSIEIDSSESCEENESTNLISESEQCNIEACDPDQLAMMVDCKDTEYGCCPTDNSTPADETLSNCPTITAESIESCSQSEYGCCPVANADDKDEFENSRNLTLALGPYGIGCPIHCSNTQFGCCPDMITVANSSDLSECPMSLEETTTMMTTTMEPTTTMMTTIAEFEQTTLSTDTIPIAGLSFVNCSDEDDPSLCSMSTTSANLVRDCSRSKFGCCPDGWNEAQGPNGEGCEEGSGDISTFLASTIDSVMNLFVTSEAPVTGDDIDCSLTEFGCCPNGKKKAIGPRYYGCTCHDYPFGCCQDEYTPASGENLEGCLCERMLYGCCADGRTPAKGQNREGCDCTSSPYGCCSDMFTFAKGPNYQGCPCDTLTYGCCPGSQIPARGPDFTGCSCADTPFGCCADGITVAYGPKFEGCPSGLPLDMKLNSEVCKLPKESGPCSNFSVQWFFDNESGRCNRFWYGGCQGNGNRFSSQEQCERSCVKPEGPERCLLPKISGPCNSSSEAYYYDDETKRCERFLYGGCLGNTNRFETMEQCVQTCIYQETALDQCDQPPQPGPCRGSYTRWYYRREEGRCRDFSYGGCHGNLNNFQTEDECQSACASRTPFEICVLPVAQGSCLGSFPRWFFDSRIGQCHEFTYSGCGGNKNRFIDRVSCEQLCNQTIPDYFYPTQRQPYDQRQPSYPYSDRDNEIVPVVPPSSYESVCALPQAHGNCRDNIIQWYFDINTRRCERFYYSGCGGNDNRFNDQIQCEQKCLAYASQITPMMQHDPCLEPKDLGDTQCQDYRHRWHYDVEDRRCHRFYYYGCGGNRNNFETEEECSARCVLPRERGSQQQQQQVIRYGQRLPTHSDAELHGITSIEEFHPENCFKQYDSGPCEKNHIQWHYDSRDGVCKEFIYGGCEGNENRFHSQQECQTKCWNSQDICKLPQIRGSCTGNFTQFYYDHQSQECYEFQFSGCYGNANRFNSKETCEQQCRTDYPMSIVSQQQSSQTTPVDQHHQQQQPQQPQISDVSIVNETHLDRCHQPMAKGPCRAYFVQYYYSAEENRCQMFIYGGCDGNENRFDSEEDCEKVCKTTPSVREDEEEPREGIDLPEVVCLLKMEQGSCHETRAKWWYDPNSHTCFPFVYSGCKGNKNRFADFDSCIRFCSGVSHQQQSQYPPTHQVIYPAPTPIQEPSRPEPTYPYIPQTSRPLPTHEQPVHPGCVPMECQEENCILGIDYYHDHRGCPVCRCVNPCNDIRCPEEMNCAVELFRDEVTGKIRANAECRLRVKPGQCPRNIHIVPESEREQSLECYDQCRSDADCREFDKCCNNGCADICVAPEGYYTYQELSKTPSLSSSPTPTAENNQSTYYYSPTQDVSQQHSSYYNYSVVSQQQQTNNGDRQQPPYAEGSSYNQQQSTSDHRYPNTDQRPNVQYGYDVVKSNGHPDQVIHPSDQHIYHTTNGGGMNDNGQNQTKQQQPNYSYDPNQQQQPGQQQTDQYQIPIEEDSNNNIIRNDQHPSYSNQDQSTNNQQQHYQDPYQQSIHSYNYPYEHPDQRQHEQYQYNQQQQQQHVYNADHQEHYGDRQSQRQPEHYPGSVVVRSGQEEAILDCPSANETMNFETIDPNKSTSVIWIKDGQQIDQSLDRYDLLSNGSLRILNIEPNDRGIYYCLANSKIGYQMVPLEVNEPARISSEGPKRVIAQIGMPIHLHCRAMGSPEPKVTWWRGNQMLPINDRKYQQWPNHTLIIQRVEEKDIGYYTCHATNGIEPEEGERKDIELLLDQALNKRDELEIVPYDPSLFANNKDQHNGDHKQPNQQNNNEINLANANDNNVVHEDPIMTEIDFWPKDYRVGTPLYLDCIVRNQRTGQVIPSANVVWYVRSDIPLLVDETNRHHYMLMANNSLLVYNLTRGDSGEYRCRASTGPKSDSYSSVNLQVENIHIPADCQDSPVFANCATIVQMNYCSNPRFHEFCCRSCYIAEYSRQKPNGILQSNEIINHDDRQNIHPK